MPDNICRSSILEIVQLETEELIEFVLVHQLIKWNWLLHSNIREHFLSCDHPIISDNFSVLAKCPTYFWFKIIGIHLYS